MMSDCCQHYSSSARCFHMWTTFALLLFPVTPLIPGFVVLVRVAVNYLHILSLVFKLASVSVRGCDQSQSDVQLLSLQTSEAHRLDCSHDSLSQSMHTQVSYCEHIGVRLTELVC